MQRWDHVIGCWLGWTWLLLCGAVVGGARADDALLVRDSIVDAMAHNFPVVTYSVATVHGVTFQQEGVITYKGWQYAAYYQGNNANSTGKVAVARRRLPDGAWQSLVFNDYAFTTTDSHNDVVLGICPGDGSIHLSFDHHVSTLHYRFSRAGLADRPDEMSWDASQFGAVLDRLIPTSAAMTQVTYPRFIPTPAGSLLFSYRFGSSGGGDEMLLEYSGVTRTWSNVGQYTTRTGSYTGTLGTGTDRNAYFDDTVFDDQGRLHATWCWRETPDGGSNHDLNYAYSDDVGRTWKNELGTTVATAGSSYLSINSPGIRVWSIPQKRNYINNSAMTVDKQGRVHVVAWMLPAAAADQATFTTSLSSASRFIHYWRGIDGVWRRNETAFTGTRAKLVADADGRLFLVYGDATNLRILAANPASNPEQNPAASWSDWAALQLSAALPAGRANTVNIILDRTRWNMDRVLSVYAQETNVSGTAPTPLHVLDYHVSRAAVLPSPVVSAVVATRSPTLSWLAGQQAISHDVYCGKSADAVRQATTSSSEYLGRVTSPQRQLSQLDTATTYYWRVDGINAAGSVATGQVWSFTTSDLLPTVAPVRALRRYGGGVDFVCTVAVTDESLATAQLELFYGSSDAATQADGWDQRVELGEKTSGTHTLSLEGVPAGLLYYRYRITTRYGSTWSPVTSQVSGEDLAQWQYSAVITVNGIAAGETLTDFPLLVRISPSVISGFSYDQLRAAAAGDLRFSNLAGDQFYDYEIENWNTSGTSHVWVKVPQLSQGSALRLWWGCAGKTAASSTSTWSAGFSGVWHLDSSRGVTVDSSPASLVSTANNLANASTAVSAGAAGLNGSSSSVAIANAAALSPAYLTIEAWVKTTSAAQMQIFSRDFTTGVTPQRAWQLRLNSGKPEVIFFNNTTNNNALAATTAIHDNQFHHVAASWDGVTIRLYVDGALKNSLAFAGPLRGNLTNAAFIGRSENLNANFFNGSIDEVRLSSSARSAAWLQTCWNNQRVGSTLLTSTAASRADLDADGLADAWEMQYFSGIATAAAQAQSDADGDGLVNWVEQALGRNPVNAADAGTVLTLPQKVGQEWRATFERSTIGAAVAIVVETSPDLSANSWSSSLVTQQRLSTGERETWQASCTSAAPRLFFRLRLQR